MTAQKYCPRCYGKLVGDGYRDRSGLSPELFCCEECADVFHGRVEGQEIERRILLKRAREVEGRLNET